MQAIVTADSVSAAGGVIRLVNDEASPAADSFYGTDSGGLRGWYLLSSEGVSTVAGTTGQVLVDGDTAPVGGAVTLSLPTAIVDVDSITSTAGQPLVLATGTSGTAMSIASATNIVTFSAGIAGTTFSGTSGTFSTLTSGRVPFASTGGLLVDDADFTFATDTLTATKGTFGSITHIANAIAAANSVTSVAGQNLVLALGTGGTALTLTNSTLAATFAGDLTISGGNVGIGIAVNAAQALLIGTSTLTGTSQIGLVSAPTFSSAATVAGQAGYFRVLTAAASFTMPIGRGITVDAPSVGADSAITVQTGVLVENQGATGITHAYGVDIAAQSGAATTNVGLRNAGTTLLTNATASTSTTTGALVVSGGVGVAGAIYGGSNLSIASTGTFVGSVTGANLLVAGDNQYVGRNSNNRVLFNAGAGYTDIYGNGIITRFATSGVTVNATTEATTGGEGSLTTAGGIFATKAIISDSDTASTTSQTGGIIQNGSSAATSVGIGGGNINAGGSITAVSKSFVIPHPSKRGYRLQHGVIEGDAHRVYQVGRLTNSSTITLPPYWAKLVNPASVTVHITPTGRAQDLYVYAATNRKVVIKAKDGRGAPPVDCFYYVTGERVDVPTMQVELKD